MMFFTAITALITIGAVVAAPVNTRDVKVGLVNNILTTMNSTFTQDQAISNQVLAQMKAGTASEVALAQQMASILAQMGSDIESGESQIASTLQSAAVTLAAPDIAVFTQDLQAASAYAQVAMATFAQQASAAAAAFDAQTAATTAAEILAAEAVLQPFLNPMIAYAKAVQGDGSAQAAAGMAGLTSAAAQCVALVESLNQILGISTS